jgi:hypothetical protein
VKLNLRFLWVKIGVDRCGGIQLVGVWLSHLDTL